MLDLGVEVLAGLLLCDFREIYHGMQNLRVLCDGSKNTLRALPDDHTTATPARTGTRNQHSNC